MAPPRVPDDDRSDLSEGCSQPQVPPLPLGHPEAMGALVVGVAGVFVVAPTARNHSPHVDSRWEAVKPFRS